jgi:hypothetical protein
MYYDIPADPTLLWQGDIIKDFVVPDPPDRIFIVRNPPPSIPSTIPFNGKNLPIRAIFTKGDLQDAFASTKEALVVDATLTNVAIVSQSCDIDRKPFLTVAVVRPISSVGNADRREALKKWEKVFEYFWLPSSAVLQESYIDLTLLYSVRAETLKAKINDRILSMSVSYRETFKYKVAQYFSRPDF